MLVSFTDSYYELLYSGGKYPGKPRFPSEVIKLYRMRIDQIKNSSSTQDLRNFKSLRFEKLEPKNSATPRYSIRVNDQYRLEFYLSNIGKIEIADVIE